MKIKIIVLKAMIIALLPLSVIAQTDYRRGYIISNQGDTINGLIDYRGNIRNSRLCTFKSSKNAEATKYEPGDIAAFRFINGKFYITKNVKVDNRMQPIFLEYIVDGIADLYYYREASVDRYFVDKEGVDLMELTNEKVARVTKDGRKGATDSNNHIRLLKAAFADCMDVQPQIDRAELDHESLISITRNYHDLVCDGEKCIVYQKKIDRGVIRYAPVVGVNISKLTFLMPIILIIFLKTR